MQVEKNLELVTIAGTRPEIIKLSTLVGLLGARIPDHALIYTGQHFSDSMRNVFFEELGVRPDVDLGLDTSNVSMMVDGLTRFLKSTKPHFVLVYGDTNSSLAGALAARDAGCKVLHIEAGLRCFDLQVPEERVRIKIDSMSSWLFPPTELSKLFLQYEQIDDNVYVTGNLIVDVCKKLAESQDFNKNRSNELPSNYILLTLHRQENVDDFERLAMLIHHLKEIKSMKVVFPIHPRTKLSLAKFNMSLPDNVIKIEPAGYTKFLSLMKGCDLVLTDSGGVQEEAIVLQKPCVTLRHVSERWETLLLRANVLFPLFRKDSLGDVVDQMRNVKIERNPYGENVADNMFRIIDRLVQASAA